MKSHDFGFGVVVKFKRHATVWEALFFFVFGRCVGEEGGGFFAGQVWWYTSQI